ncbi:uncharacterized protein LOC118433179 [Folsomia candida]|uniref:uncharacterized protein LOC118433179 n=1 Tax=Folsomia candida TaxID=158441 RepID=UPI001604F269|nr:uncharacterized protein LOC118433179 [Folsomia candida]
MAPIATIILLLVVVVTQAHGNMDYNKIKLKPIPRQYLDPYSKLRSRTPDKYTGCMCPTRLNTTGSFYMFCGPELNPKEGGVCLKEGIYRCIDGQKEAIMTVDCEKLTAGATICYSTKYCPPAIQLNDCTENNVKACDWSKIKR